MRRSRRAAWRPCSSRRRSRPATGTGWNWARRSARPWFSRSSAQRRAHWDLLGAAPRLFPGRGRRASALREPGASTTTAAASGPRAVRHLLDLSTTLGLTRQQGADLVGVAAIDAARRGDRTRSRRGAPFKRPGGTAGGVTGLPSDDVRCWTPSSRPTAATSRAVERVTIGLEAVQPCPPGDWDARRPRLERGGSVTRRARRADQEVPAWTTYGAPRYPELVLTARKTSCARTPERAMG